MWSFGTVNVSTVGGNGCSQDARDRGPEEAASSPRGDLGPPGCHGAGERSPRGREAEGACRKHVTAVVAVFAFSYWRARPGSYSSLCPLTDPEPHKALPRSWTLLFAEQMVVLPTHGGNAILFFTDEDTEVQSGCYLHRVTKLVTAGIKIGTRVQSSLY